MITEAHTKEMLSMAFLSAIAAKAGVNLRNIKVYDYGVDGTFVPVDESINGRKVDSGFPLDFQLKSTVNWQITNSEIVYDLDAKNYNDMVYRNNIKKGPVPLILILLCLPKDKNSWLKVTEDMLVMKKCCYWHYINISQGQNKKSVRVKIPVYNLFDSEKLINLLEKVENGGFN